MNEELKLKLQAWRSNGLNLISELSKCGDSAEVNDYQDMIINGLGLAALEVLNANKDD